jgi:hypothetical protein
VDRGAHRFEAFFFRTGIRLFVTDARNQPVEITSLSCSATFFVDGNPAPWFTRHLIARGVSPDHPEASLDLALDLSSVPTAGVSVDFDVTGLPGDAMRSTEFRVPLSFVETTTPASRPIPSAAPATSQPTYVYGPGASGLGYYYYPGPGTTQAAAPTSSGVVYSYAHPAVRAERDWSTGRDYPRGGLIDKPWLTPIME